MVRENLTVMDHPEIFVIGDLARVRDPDGGALPGVAPVAMQMGKYVAAMIRARLDGERDLPAFAYDDRGNLAVIGRKHAVAEMRQLHFSGFFAWLLWLFVHLLYIVEYESRLLVAVQWAWSYFTRNRGARLITETALRPFRIRDRRSLHDRR